MLRILVLGDIASLIPPAQLGAVGSKQVVEDRGFNLMMEHQALGQEKVIQATYNTRTDPNTVTLKIDDGIDHNGRCVCACEAHVLQPDVPIRKAEHQKQEQIRGKNGEGSCDFS